MIPQKLANATRVVGGLAAGQPGYLPLDIVDIHSELIGEDGTVTPGRAMVTAWRPTETELAALNAGAPVILSIMGSLWPPVNLFVQEPEIDAGAAQ